jgi:acetyl esterase/lipase
MPSLKVGTTLIFCNEKRPILLSIYLIAFFVVVTLCCSPGPSTAAVTDVAPPTSFADFNITFDVTLIRDVIYRRIKNEDLRLDIYTPRNVNNNDVTVANFHGGGWIKGSRQQYHERFLPYLKRGWNVIDVEYRVASSARAPAAVEDCRCALRWLAERGQQLGIDSGRIVLSGGSAGGHLALITGMLTGGAGFDRCPPFDEAVGQGQTSYPDVPVTAIVNWYGITDVNDLLEGPHERSFAKQWIGNDPGAQELAQKVSPMTYARPGIPPILTVHGDADATVPYDQALRFNEALERAGTRHFLLTVRGGGHGNFTAIQWQDLWSTVFRFLDELGLQAGARSQWLVGP